MARALAALPPSIRDAVERFAVAVRELAGPRLRTLLVFGSYARDDATEYSDVDVAVVVDEVDTVPRLNWNILDAAGKVFEDTNILIAPSVFETQLFEKWKRQERRLVRDILRDGIPA